MEYLSKYTEVIDDKYKLYFNYKLKDDIYECTYYVNKLKIMGKKDNTRFIINNVSAEVIDKLFTISILSLNLQNTVTLCRYYDKYNICYLDMDDLKIYNNSSIYMLDINDKGEYFLRAFKKKT